MADLSRGGVWGRKKIGDRGGNLGGDRLPTVAPLITLLSGLGVKSCLKIQQF